MHKQALATAVEFSPADLKNSIRIHRKPMYRRLKALHDSPSSLKPYKTIYEELVDLGSKRDRRRYEHMAGTMADISMYIFSKLSPGSPSGKCSDKKILEKVSFMYDGFDRNPDYRAAAFVINGDQTTGGDERPLFFYNSLVNEVLDLWVTIWEDAGRDIRDLPEEYTLKLGPGNESFLSFLPVETVKRLGKHSLESNRPAEAARAFEEILSLDSSDKTALYGLGMALFRMQKYHDSLKYFKKIGEYEDALYYVGLLAEMSGRDTALTGEKLKLYSESYEAFKSYAASGGTMAANAQKRLGEVGDALLRLYEQRISSELSVAGEALNEAKANLSTYHLNEFDGILKEINRKNEYYISAARYLRGAGLGQFPTRNFSDSIKKLKNRAKSTRTAINRAIRGEEKKKPAPEKKETKKEPKQAPQKKQQVAPKPKIATPKPAPPAPAPETLTAAKKPEPAGINEDVKARVRDYSKREERKTIIRSFKEGYRGSSCEEVKGAAFVSYSKHGPKKEAEEWARMQKSSCLSGKKSKSAGLTYYQSLSDYLTSLPE